MAITQESVDKLGWTPVWGSLGAGAVAGGAAGHFLDEKVLENHIEWFDTFAGSSVAILIPAVVGAILGLYATNRWYSSLPEGYANQ